MRTLPFTHRSFAPLKSNLQTKIVLITIVPVLTTIYNTRLAFYVQETLMEDLGDSCCVRHLKYNIRITYVQKKREIRGRDTRWDRGTRCSAFKNFHSPARETYNDIFTRHCIRHCLIGYWPTARTREFNSRFSMAGAPPRFGATRRLRDPKGYLLRNMPVPRNSSRLDHYAYAR